MLRAFWLTGIGVFVSGLVVGQIKQQFSVEDNAACETVRLQIKSNRGNVFIKPSHNNEILSVFSNQEPGSYGHHFVKEVNGRSCDVSLTLEDQGSRGFSQTISSRVFTSESTVSDKIWKMYLSDEKPYSLDLAYGLGNANIDLSGLAVKNLKINTASADVLIGYFNGIENLVSMDTLRIKVDLGSVQTKNISLAKTKYIITDVGFGNVTLDFGSQSVAGNVVKGSVGAGNLVVVLPRDEQVPVLVKVKDSWLCSVRMPSSIQKTGANIYTNEAYRRDNANALQFDLDVSMGNIVFKQVSAHGH
jgi:hypothetical protein